VVDVCWIDWYILIDTCITGMIAGRTFEHHRDPASQLINAWSTDYVTLRQLIDCLQSAGLLREASFIHGLVDEQHEAPAAHSPDVTPAPSAAAAVHYSPDSLHIPFTKLIKWTRNFDENPAHSGGCLLGQGGYSHVFKGSKQCHWPNCLANATRRQ